MDCSATDTASDVFPPTTVLLTLHDDALLRNSEVGGSASARIAVVHLYFNCEAKSKAEIGLGMLRRRLIERKRER